MQSFFFVVGAAVHDAGVTAWYQKRKWNYVRPITAINYLVTNGIIAASFAPFQNPTVLTPPFPEYFSGHSCFSSAAATVMTMFTGSASFGFTITVLPNTNYISFDPTVPANPVTLTFNTFRDAANSAGMSRLYGGIHFTDGNLQAQAGGILVGQAVMKKANFYFAGSANSLHCFFFLLISLLILNF